MALELSFFGSPEILVDGHSVPLRHRRAVLLLALLAVRSGRPVERTALADAIWPDMDPDDAATNLRRALADLRDLLSTEADRIKSDDRRSLALEASSDIVEFDEAARRFSLGANHDQARAALEIYRGPFIDGWNDLCVEAERVYRARVAADIAEALCRAELMAGNIQEALRLCDRAEAAFPLRESTFRLRLDAHLKRGDRAAALAAYGSFADQLERNLGLAPAEDIRRLIDRIPQHQIRKSAKTGLRPLVVGGLIGRDSELATLGEDLKVGGIITIVGPGGVGKTRLALAAIQHLKSTSFIDLTALAADASVTTVFDEITSETEVLVLDNAEHLMPAISIAAEAASRDHRVVLTTSRSPLGVAGERIFRLSPLRVDSTGRSAAAELFIERAQSSRASLQMDEELVLKICRRLDGLPLAIELAAARVKSLSLAELEQELSQQNGLKLLSGGSISQPERHRTMASTVKWSLSLLAEDTKQALVALTSFRSGFTVEAAAALIGEDRLDLLRDLVDQSLLFTEEQDGVTRYRLFETVRAIVSEEADLEEPRKRLAEWAASLADAAYNELWHGDAAQWTNKLEAEWVNLKAGLDASNGAQATRIVNGIDPIWWRQWKFREATEWREIARVKELADGGAFHAEEHLISRELFRRQLGEPNSARSVLRSSIDSNISARRFEQATYQLVALGNLELADGELDRALATMEEAVRLAPKVGEAGFVSYAYNGIAIVEMARGDAARASSLLQEVVSDFSKEKFKALELMSAAHLAESLFEIHDLAGAGATFERVANQAREKNMPVVEQQCEIGKANVSIATGCLLEASEAIDRAEKISSNQDAIAIRARLATVKSKLARAEGTADPMIVLMALLDPVASQFPYLEMLNLLIEGSDTLESANLGASARRLRSEAEAGKEAAHAGAWACSLVLTRALSAYPADLIRRAFAK